jgi:hypothetical protein
LRRSRRRLSEGERQLIRRAAALSAECERQEALWSRGEAEFDIAASSTLTNAVRRVFETLRLQRRARDVTPSLAFYADLTRVSDLNRLSRTAGIEQAGWSWHLGYCRDSKKGQ